MITQYMLAGVLAAGALSDGGVPMDGTGYVQSESSVTAEAIAEGMNVLHVLVLSSASAISLTPEEAHSGLVGLRDALRSLQRMPSAPEATRADDAIIDELDRIIAAQARGEDVREAARTCLAAIMAKWAVPQAY